MNTKRTDPITIKPDKGPPTPSARMTVVAGAGCYVPPTDSANNERLLQSSPGKVPAELTSHERYILAEARRILGDLMFRQSDALSHPDTVTEYLVHHLADREREVFGVLHLDSTNRVIRQRDLFEGTVSTSAVYPREVVRDALLSNARRVILYHNHPSLQSAQPSQSDITLTHQIVDALATVGIEVLDHLIVSGTHSFSFARNSQIPKSDIQ
ncbi:MAG: DNA repair protein RadC [Marinobacter sp. T13-3]|nr:MAG: DNA repair protein RadC [Marinobacter sp. T13-3]